MKPEFLATRRGVLAGITLAAAPAAAQDMSEPNGPWTSSGFVQRDGGRIRYATLGQGEPLVLLHKLGGWIADWRFVAPSLAQTRMVIAIDLPGHGDSVMLGPPPYMQTVPETAASVMAVLDELGIDRFSLLGSSLGGCVGVVMASLWPQSVSRLALLSVALTAPMSLADLHKQDAAVAGQYGPHGEPLGRSADLLKRFGSTLEVNREFDLSRAKAGVWVRPSERGVGRAGVKGYLGGVIAPTLLIYGEHGYYRQFEAPARAAVKDVTTAVIPGSGSFTQQEKPAETAAAVKAFLDAPKAA